MLLKATGTVALSPHRVFATLSIGIVRENVTVGWSVGLLPQHSIQLWFMALFFGNDGCGVMTAQCLR